MAGKKINFRGAMDSIVKNQFPDLKMETPAVELTAKLINDVNSAITASIEKDFKSAKLVDEIAFLHFAQKAITKVFPGDMTKNALSEAHKQLALLQSGCMVYGDDDRVSQQLKKVREGETSETLKRQKRQRDANLFKNGVKKAFVNFLPDLSLDFRAGDLLGHRMHNFAKIVADQASKVYENKDELQPTDIKSIVSKYVESKAMSGANSEGNKSLLMFESGLIDFKPRKTIKSGWSQETVAKDKIFSSVFKPGVKKLLKDTNPDAQIDAKAPKFLGHILMDVAKYLAETTADNCKKKKIQEMGNKELEAAVTAAFPEQLRQHAILHASENVAEYSEGLLSYERKTEKPVKRKAPTDLKSGKSPSKRRKLVSGKRSTSGKRKTPSKRSSSKSPASKSRKKKPPSTPRRARVQAPPPKKSIFAPLCRETVPAIFTNADVVVSRDASNHTGGVLEDVCEALISALVSNGEKSGVIGQEQVVEAVCNVLPKQLAELAVAFGSETQSTDADKTK